MEEGLVKSECYICMEACEYKSPCICATHVHPECLVRFLETSGHTHCTICMGAFPVPPRPPRRSYKRVVVFVAIPFFFLFGWLGSVTAQETYEPFSELSILSAIAAAVILLLFWRAVIHTYLGGI